MGYAKPSIRQWMAAFGLIALTSGCASDQPKNVDRQMLMKSVGPSLRSSAKTAEDQEDFAAAAGYYRSLRVMFPDEVGLDVKLSRILRYDRKTAEALPIIRRALKAHPHKAILLIELGKIQIDMSRPKEAITTLEEAKGLTPDNWEIYSALGVAYDYTGQWAKAQETYRVGLGLAPNALALVNNLALSLAQSGDLTAAVKALERATQRVDATPRMRQNLALFKALQGNSAEAARLARQDLPKNLADQNVEFLRILSEQRRPLP